MIENYVNMIEGKIEQGTRCVDCGKLIEIGNYDEETAPIRWKDGTWRCGECANKYLETECYKRIVGYLRPMANWNPGKLAEDKDKIDFKIKSLQT